jgi:FAD/FMN-containing dehydrogenase
MDVETERVAGVAERLELRTWFGDLVSYPHAVVEAASIEEVVAALRDTVSYPSPVRARGSGHSPALCGEADGGTVVEVTRMNRILDVGAETVTAEAGALFIDVAKELERRGLQFYVNLEFGNVTLGSLACCATKDASMPGEFGQASSYCVGMKLVTPDGEIVEVTEEDPDLLLAARSSYGLLGIVVEVTFKIRPLQAMWVSHEVFGVEDFAHKLPELTARGDSMMLYIFPATRRIGVEFRRYAGDARDAKERPNHTVWWLRNFAWKTFSPSTTWAIDRLMRPRRPHDFLARSLDRLNQLVMTRIVKAGHTVPTDQIIRYPKVAGRSSFTFSMWTFPEERYAATLREYFSFVDEHFSRTGFRPNLLDAGYRIEQDRSSLFSYAWNGPVLTIDPVTMGGPGWTGFLEAFNEFASAREGTPLFNQTWGLTADQVRTAFGDRIATFKEYRRRFDPSDRLLNGYFRELLGVGR